MLKFSRLIKPKALITSSKRTLIAPWIPPPAAYYTCIWIAFGLSLYRLYRYPRDKTRWIEFYIEESNVEKTAKELNTLTFSKEKMNALQELAKQVAQERFFVVKEKPLIHNKNDFFFGLFLFCIGVACMYGLMPGISGKEKIGEKISLLIMVFASGALIGLAIMFMRHGSSRRYAKKLYEHSDRIERMIQEKMKQMGF